jgi:hypothetical protein
VRIVISTHGFLSDRMARVLPEIVRVHPQVGLRVSLDAVGPLHDEIRGVPDLARLDAELAWLAARE